MRKKLIHLSNHYFLITLVKTYFKEKFNFREIIDLDVQNKTESGSDPFGKKMDPSFFKDRVSEWERDKKIVSSKKIERRIKNRESKNKQHL